METFEGGGKLGFGELIEEDELVNPVFSANFCGLEVGDGEVALGTVVALEKPEFEIKGRKAFFFEVFQGDDVSEGL